ncbi:putative methyltransferase PMT10 [Zea mays]|uniref:Methyltransferase n=1 Tax=Zea mays TaxID=4577 RepID=A0A1D6G8J2_MAIZE|nr:putative methyltransferase PMT10 [Zea mays]
MQDDFDIGNVGANDTDLATDETAPQEPSDVGASGGPPRVRIERFPVCPESMREYIPCLDNEDDIKRLPSTERGERFERHCPAKDKGLSCLVPAPNGYKAPIPWPRSRDEVWFSNVPHTRLIDDKGGQNWITKVKDKFRFPGGGTQFIHGANQYLDQISQMVPNVAFGSHTRVVLDVGCGVASFGAYLLSRDVLTLSIAPKDVHENQIQFALERGVPAMAAAFATRRLLYTSQAFDIIHCSRCRINWTRDDGILLLEVNRLLRAGGYFAWAAQPVYKHEEAQQEAWKEMENLTARLCWEFVKKEGYIAMWRKPLNNSCYINRGPEGKPPLCDADDNPDDVWYSFSLYVGLKACISRLPENGEAPTPVQWPARLMEPPKRLQGVEMDAYSSKNELFKAETKFWDDIIDGYIRIFKWRKFKVRNVMDMRAGFGGFAAALIRQKLDWWVMNVVPISEPNTLPVIFDRGLLGVAHDWCEPFDTYPRTYDLLHASGLFSKEQNRCNISSILLEMDRILRPGGKAYIRDRKEVIQEIKEITNAMGWRGTIRDTAEGAYASRKVLMCDKPMAR